MNSAKIREAFSHWGPWMVLAYIGLVAVTVAGFSLNANTLKRDAAKDAAVARCLTSRPQLMRISTHLQGVTELADVLVTNGTAALEATPTSDPQYQPRLANLRRLVAAQRNIHAVKRLPVPSVAVCKAARP